ncbi:dTDP-4-amino-4,6-dideoxygalactose transaminase [Alkalispirochaeta americana]|uniref:dTDP-4-amino-4,6-dideoxygalactose transaminase n=1 Tax=Alkalispirochaeta americana TaxID=159291 RepID=A0A1N6PJ43_9SPIO|nr:DegT/DnrJ/EryC1/StrS family aminotransferase [Alkalispirochaeta americana]SIQ04375.1 dTDP-4-amino-4,6-dideoxygalactose transaminase [Alkalispirochaeta americana]
MIPTFRPTIRRADMDAVLTRLAEDSIGSGVLASEFSQKLAKYLNRRSGVSLRSWGLAFRAALTALTLPAGARIGCSVLAPEAVRRQIELMGFEAVLLDTQKEVPLLPSPLNVDYEIFRLDAIYVDTRLGFVADLESFSQLGIPLIEDVSEGLGGNTGSVMAGSVGELAIIGLEPDHIITAGGGAVVATSNTRRVSALNSAVNGESGDLPLPDMNSALGLTQMKQLETFIERRRELARRFMRTLQRTRHSLPVQPGEGENVYFALPVLVESSPRDVEHYARTHGVTVIRAFQETILNALSDADTSREEPPEADSESGTVLERYPHALSLAGRMVLFPLFPTLSKADQERIERVLATLP